jgi:hypothetical protein
MRVRTGTRGFNINNRIFINPSGQPLSVMVGKMLAMEVHRMRWCRFEIDEERRRATTIFDDGSELAAAPVMDEENIARARSLGYVGSDEEAVWEMTRHHDLVHTLLAEAEGFPFSLTLHSVANGYEMPPGMAQREERIVFLIQRLLNVGLAAVLREP